MVSDGGGESAIKNHRHRLSHHLYETYATVVTSTFRYQGYCLSVCLLREYLFPECHIYQLHHHLQLSIIPHLPPILSPFLGPSLHPLWIQHISLFL